MELTRGKQKKPVAALIYGTAGVGKSTICNIKGSVFVDCEDGLNFIDCLKTPHIKNLDMLRDAVTFISKREDITTVVFDSADAIEKMFAEDICSIASKNGKKKESLGDFGYGQGYELLLARWNKFIDWFEALKKMGKNVIIIGHDMTKRFDDPRFDGYDKTVLKVHQKSAGALIARMDAVLYMSYEMVVDTGDNDMQKNKAIGRGNRIIYTQERPAYSAKNRLGLPEKVKEVQSIFSFMEPNVSDSENNIKDED